MESLTDYTLSIEAKEVIELPKSEVRNLELLKDYQFDNKYVCDKTGQVYRIKGENKNNFILLPLNPYLTRDKYVEYVIYDKFTKKKHIQGQRIVAGLFLDAIPNKIYVNHKDGNRQNNNLANLEYVTHSENIKHSWDFLRNRNK